MKIAVVALVALAAAGLLAVAAGGPAYEVRGNAAVPYDAGTVKEVRVLGSATVYVDGEPKPGPSVIGESRGCERSAEHGGAPRGRS